MIDKLITALNQQVGMSASEIADTLWLALQIQESPSFPLVKEDEREKDNKTGESDGKISRDTQSQTPDSKKTPTNQSSEERKAGIYPRNRQQSSKSLDLSFKTPNAPSLREPLTLARALKPLMGRVPSGRNPVLDEAATIQRIVDEELWLDEDMWLPVLRFTLEPWLDLELVVDESISMQIWRQTIGDLQRLLKNYGIFRDVRVWGLIDDLKQMQIRRGMGAMAKNQPLRSPKELIDGSGRRLVLVVSDCVSSCWRDGKVTKTLELWANHVPMAIIQMLPKWLWKRTALGRTSEVRLRGLTPGVPNHNLIAKEVSLWDELEEGKGVKVPVFTLEADKVATWAQMLSGKSSIWTAGVVFKLDATPVNKENRLFNLDYSQLTAEQRVQAFRVTASPMARKLAGLLAAAPVITLPVVRLIREAFQKTLLKDSLQVNVAEVFLGGLLKPLSEINAETNPDEVLYEFMDGVRELLVDSVPTNYVLNVVDEVSEHVAKKVGWSLEYFTAVFKNPQEYLDSKIPEEVSYFATVTPRVLRRLGGEYAKVAEELELNNYARSQKYITNYSISETFEHGYALLIGVGESAYKRFSLPVTVKDTQAIYATLIDPDLCAYHKEHILVLNNEEATYDGILNGLKWLGQKAEADREATVLVYYSGHRWVDKNDDRYYLLPHDIKPFNLPEYALSTEVFVEALRQITAKHLLVIIDACNAGKMVELRDSAVFSSCQADQKSSTKKDNSMSIYTFHLLEALRGTANKPGDKTVNISHLMSYLSETVPKTAKSLNQEQTPYFNINSDNFAIAKLRGGNGLPHVPLLSEKEINYTQLRQLLTAQNWKEADEETARLMLQASGQEERGWLTEKDMQEFPSTDLQTIDQLWFKYSNGKFGFTVQKQIWLIAGGQIGYDDDDVYKKFGENVGWYVKDKDEWLLWIEHTFSLNAPQGHLPRYLPSQAKRIRPYIFYRQDLKAPIENVVSQEEQLLESNENKEVESIASILEKIDKGQQTADDMTVLRQWLQAGDREIVTGLGYNISAGEGREIVIGDRIYQQWDEEAIAALVNAIQQVSWQCVASLTEKYYTPSELDSTIPVINELGKSLMDFTEKNVIRYGLKLAFSPNPNQEYFISGGNEIIKRWQKPKKTWEREQQIYVKGYLDAWFTSVAISPDGQLIAACRDYEIKIWRYREERALHTWGKTVLKNYFDASGFDSVAFSPDGKILAANDNQDIKLYDVETGKQIVKLSGHADKVTCVAFNPNKQRILASCSYDQSIKLWDIDSQRCLGTLSGHQDAVYTLAFSSDGEIIASGSKDNNIKLWNLNAGEIPETLRQHSDAVTCLVFSPDGRTLVSGSNDGTIVEWNLLEKESQTFHEQHRRGVTSIAMSPDGETLISGGRDQTIKVWRR